MRECKFSLFAFYASQLSVLRVVFVEPDHPVRIALHAVRGSLGTDEPLFDVGLLLRIGEHAKPQADPTRHRTVVKQVGHKRTQQLLVILLVRAVQKERVPAFPAADSLGLACEPPDAPSHAVQHMVAELTPVPLVDRVQVVDVAGQRV